MLKVIGGSRVRCLAVFSSGFAAALSAAVIAPSAYALPTHLTTTTLSGANAYVVSGGISPDGRFAYYATTNSSPGRVVKVRLSDMSEVATAVLNSGETNLTSTVISPDGQYGYFGREFTHIPGVVVKVDLSTMTRVGAVTFQSGEGGLRSAVIAPEGQYAYFGTYELAARVVKVRLSDMTRVAATPPMSESSNFHWAVISPDGDYGYFGSDTNPATVTKVRLSDMTRVSYLTLNSGEQRIRSGVISPAGDFAFFGTTSSPARVIKVRLSDMSRVSALQLGSGDNNARGAMIAPDGSAVYVGLQVTPGRFAKLDPATMLQDGPTLVLNDGVSSLDAAVESPDGRFAYFGTSSSPAVVAKIKLANTAIAPWLPTPTTPTTPTPTTPTPTTPTTPTPGGDIGDPDPCVLAADPPTGAIGISVNGGDDFTKSTAVKVKLIWPSCGERVVLSNDGGFGGTKAVKLAAQVSWKLKSSGSERLPKIVYARYLDVGEDESALSSGSLSTFTDDIILDTTAPTITSATLARAGSARVAALKSYKLRVRAADQTSGVTAIQLAVDRRRPLTSVKYSASKTVRLAARPVWVRVADGAGNQSPWKRLR